PQPVRPAIERAGRALLVIRRQVPLPERRRAVAVLLKRSWKRGAVLREEARVAGKPGRQLADRSKPHRVMVATGEQRRSRRRAQRRDVEAVVPQSLLGRGSQVRGGDRFAERARVTEPRV